MAGATTIKVRTSIDGGVCTVRAMIRHPMETGQRKDAATGARIPAHHITELICEHNGTVVLRCDWGTGIARNPYLSFKFKDAAAGDTLALRWTDNRGDSDALQVVIG